MTTISARDEMDRQELETAHREARSFPGMHPPMGARYIGYRREHGEVYMYWKDSSGKYWYDSDLQITFKREMEEAQKKRKQERKKASRRNWMPG